MSLVPAVVYEDTSVISCVGYCSVNRKWVQAIINKQKVGTGVCNDIGITQLLWGYDFLVVYHNLRG